ncbi:MAG: hypothetical protein SPI74_07775 [Eubacterium sp.]|nr:hypothetical protein [Eubacterium sp.]
MPNTTLLEIKTDKKIIYSNQVVSLTLKDTSGQEGFLPQHCDILRRIENGKITVNEQSGDSVKTMRFSIPRGYMSIDKEGIVIFSPLAEEIKI